MNAPLHVHDLLGPLPAGSVVAEIATEQAHIDNCLRSVPFAVVRRIAAQESMIPIGIRGVSREQRYAAWLPLHHITSVHTPESLRVGSEHPDLSAFAALIAVQEQWRDLNLPWGPTGSAGFSLASGHTVVTSSSDLDLLIRAHTAISPQRALEIFHSLQNLPCRVDVQIETPLGSIALAELAANTGTLMLRTSRGVSLVSNAWPETAEVLA